MLKNRRLETLTTKSDYDLIRNRYSDRIRSEGDVGSRIKMQ